MQSKIGYFFFWTAMWAGALLYAMPFIAFWIVMLFASALAIKEITLYIFN